MIQSQLVKSADIALHIASQYIEVPVADRSIFMAKSMENGVSMSRDERRAMMMKGIDPLIPDSIIEWIRTEE